MSRKSQILALVIVLLLITTSAAGVPSTALASSEATDQDDLFLGALTSTEKEVYKYKTVEKGKITLQDTYKCNVIYPSQKNVTVPKELGTVRITEMLVKTGDMVKKGTTIAKITTSINDVDLERLELNLKRMQETYHSLITTQFKSIEAQKNAVNNVVNTLDRKAATLEYKKAKANYDISKKNQERQMNILKEEINECKAKKNTTEIVSPMDGAVLSAIKANKGDKADYTTVLAKIVDPSEVLFGVKDESGYIQHNVNVNLKIYNESGASHNVTGKVITYFEILDTNKYDNPYCYIKPDKAIGMNDIKDMKIDATIDLFSLNDVMIIPNEMVYPSNQGMEFLVYELVDGMLVEKNVIPGQQDLKNTQIIDGLEVGAKIVQIK